MPSLNILGFLLPGVTVVDSQKNGGRADLSRLERSVGDGKLWPMLSVAVFARQSTMSAHTTIIHVLSI